MLTCRIKTLSEQLEDQSSKTPSLEEVSLKSELMKQKQEMINCLQDELIKVIMIMIQTPKIRIIIIIMMLIILTMIKMINS